MNASLRTLLVLFILSALVTLSFSTYRILHDLPRGSPHEPHPTAPEKKIVVYGDEFLKIGQPSGLAFTLGESRTVSHKEMQCLAKNIYHEARGEGIAGMMGVAQVTLNRADTRYRGKATLCAVVHDPNQFSWTHAPKNKPLNKAAWQQSLYVAQLMLLGIRIQGLEDALHFHSRKITRPEWSNQLPVNARIGNHIYL